MDSRIIFAFAALCVATGHGLVFGGGAEWNNLKVTWGINPLSNFNSLPRVKSDAVKGGWKRVQAFSSSGQCGERYVLNNDYAVVLIFDKNGYIAGIATGIPDSLPNFPTKQIQQFFVNDPKLKRNFVTAYFIDPQKVCGAGRSKDEFKAQGTGTTLFVQSGPSTTDAYVVPNDEAKIKKSAFTPGQCFWTMGAHYWRSTAGKITENLDCATFYPIFLLYNGNRLNGFGWAFTADAKSPRFEHPTTDVLPKFLPDPVPKCLLTQPHFTTMHIYFTSAPQTNFC